MRFKNYLDDVFKPSSHTRFFVSSGEKVEPDYKEHYDENGVRELRIDGQRNTFDEIQSHRDSVDINVLIKRYLNGDSTALGVDNGLYIDVTAFPETYAESFEIQQQVRRHFYSLDPDTRAQFNNSYEQYINALFSGKISDPTEDVVKKEVVKEEVVSDES